MAHSRPSRNRFYLVAFAYVLAWTIAMTGLLALSSALALATLVWLGFFVPTTLGGYLWEGKSFKLVAFNAAYQLVGLLVTGLAIWQGAVLAGVG